MNIIDRLAWIATASIAMIAGAAMIAAEDTDSKPVPGSVSVTQSAPDTSSEPRAVWADAHGKDQCGYWADMTVSGVTQRLRWCVPGRFTITFYDLSNYVARTHPAAVSPDEQGEPQPPRVQIQVTLTKGFWIADSACTQAMWQAVMGANPSHFTGDPQRPVEMVSWDDVQIFISKVNDKMRSGAILLPTDAQREYACRAGTQTPYAGTSLDALGWYDKNSDGRTHAVKGKLSNPWGLYDMNGNVEEWCLDWHGAFRKGAVTDPAGPASGSYRVQRGGAWCSGADACQSDSRCGGLPDTQFPNVGFRFVVQSEKLAHENGTKDF